MPQDLIITPCICGKIDCSTPYGECHCGCGGKSPIAKVNIKRIGHVKGLPIKCIHGHGRGLQRVLMEDAAPFKIDGVYCRLIPLTQGQYAIVDASDYEWMMQWRWFSKWNNGTGSYYAARQEKVEGRRARMRFMHLVILGLDFDDDRRGDHKNNITLDCRRDNLRIATIAESMRNRRRRTGNKTGFKGVTKTQSGKFSAHIYIDGKAIRVGQRDTAEAAHALYCEAAKREYGEFSNFG
jgi:hypothetical protein